MRKIFGWVAMLSLLTQSFLPSLTAVYADEESPVVADAPAPVVTDTPAPEVTNAETATPSTEKVEKADSDHDTAEGGASQDGATHEEKPSSDTATSATNPKNDEENTSESHNAVAPKANEVVTPKTENTVLRDSKPQATPPVEKTETVVDKVENAVTSVVDGVANLFRSAQPTDRSATPQPTETAPDNTTAPVEKDATPQPAIDREALMKKAPALVAKELGINWDKDRAFYAKKAGIDNYTATSEQNEALRAWLIDNYGRYPSPDAEEKPKEEKNNQEDGKVYLYFTDRANKENKFHFYAGKLVTAYLSIIPTGTKLKVNSPKLKVKFPKENLAEKVGFSVPEKAISHKFTEDDQYYYAEYEFDQLVGGLTIEMPIIYKIQNNKTVPNGFLSHAEATLYESDGTTVIAEARQDFVAETFPLKTSIGVYTQYNAGTSFPTRASFDENGQATYTSDMQVAYSNDPDTAKTRKEKSEEPRVIYRVNLAYSGAGADFNDKFGFSSEEPVRVIAHLPEGAVYRDTENCPHYSYNGCRWTYDQTNNTLTYDGKVNDLLIYDQLSDKYNRSSNNAIYLNLAYPDLPFKENGEIKTHPVRFEIITSPDTQPATINDTTLSLWWNPVIYNIESGVNVSMLNRYYDGYDWSNNKSSCSQNYSSCYVSLKSFDTGIKNSQNNQASYLIWIEDWVKNPVSNYRPTQYVSEVWSVDLDPRMYYESVQISNRRRNTSWEWETYTLRGVKADGSETEIATNTFSNWWPKIDIHDTTRQYSKLKITFSKPLAFSNNYLGFTINTALVDPENVVLSPNSNLFYYAMWERSLKQVCDQSTPADGCYYNGAKITRSTADGTELSTMTDLTAIRFFEVNRDFTYRMYGKILWSTNWETQDFYYRNNTGQQWRFEIGSNGDSQKDLYIKTLKFKNLDDKLIYTGVALYSWGVPSDKYTAGATYPYTIYGVKSDGSKVQIATATIDKYSIGQQPLIPVSDPDIRSFEIVFDTTLRFPVGAGLQFYAHSKVKDTTARDKVAENLIPFDYSIYNYSNYSGYNALLTCSWKSCISNAMEIISSSDDQWTTLSQPRNATGSIGYGSGWHEVIIDKTPVSIRSSYYYDHERLGRGIDKFFYYKKKTDLSQEPYASYAKITLSERSEGKSGAYVYELSDTLHENLYYEGFRLLSWTKWGKESDFPTSYTLYGIDKDNTASKLWTSSTKEQRISISDVDRKYKSLKVVFDQPVLMDGANLSFEIKTYLTKEAGVKITNGQIAGEQFFQTSATVKTNANTNNNETVVSTSNRCEYVYGSSYNPNYCYSMDSYGIRRKSPVIPYKEVASRIGGSSQWIWENKLLGSAQKEITMSIAAEGDQIALDDFKAPQAYLISLLPAGVEYVPGSIKDDADKSLPEPRIIPNFKSSGKTLLKFPLDTLTNESWKKYNLKNLKFKIFVSNNTTEGTNEIENYLHWNNESDVGIDYSRIDWKDEYDFDNDGNTEEKMIRLGKHSFVYVAPKELVLSNKVSDAGVIAFSKEGYLDREGDNYYKLELNNKSFDPVNNIQILSVLADIGDLTITEDRYGNYNPRNSEYRMGLLKALEDVPENQALLADWDIYYSTDAQGATTDETLAKTFVRKDQISDFSKVRMIKIVQKPGSTLGSSAVADFYIPTYLPDTNNPDRLLNARISSAVSRNNSPFSEANQAGVYLVNEYRIDGKVFSDKNEDGAFAGEEGLRDYVVKLWHENGQPALDAAGRAIETTTDALGNFFFRIYKRGTYYLTTTKRSDNDEVTQIYAPNGVRQPGVDGNDAFTDQNDPNVLRSEKFTVNPYIISNVLNVFEKPSSMIATRNFGLKLRNGRILITLIDKNNPNILLSGARFQITSEDGSTYELETNINGQTLSTDLKFGTYKIKQLSTSPDYSFSVDKEYEVVLDKGVSELPLTNENGYVTITLKSHEDPEVLLSGAEFTLTLPDGRSFDFTTDENGQFSTKKLPLGEYTLTQRSTNSSYHLLTEPQIITLDTYHKEITLTNKIKRSWLTLELTDAADNTLKLSKGKYELRNAKNELVATLTTDKDGVAKFDELPYGTYTLKQITPPQYYHLNSEILTLVIDQPLEHQDLTNVRKSGMITLTLHDIRDPKRVLQGGKYNLIDPKGNIIKTWLTTNEKGQISVSNLPYGDYTLVQTEAPAHYRLDASKIKAGLYVDQKDIKHTNKKRPRPDDEPKVQPKPEPQKPEIVPEPTPEPKPDVPVVPAPIQPVAPDPIVYREVLKKTEVVQPTQQSSDVHPQTNSADTLIKTYVKRLPKTWALDELQLHAKVGVVSEKGRKTVETSLPDAKTFRLAGSKNTDLAYWLSVLSVSERKADQYIVLPTQGLVMPVNTVSSGSKAYNNFVNGRNEDFLSYLHNGAVQLPATSKGSYGELGNKVIAGHSSYRKSSNAKYKTHFQKIIGMESGEQVWIYKKDASGKYVRYVYRVNASYNTSATDISVLHPTATDQLTLMTCTPIGWVAGRRMVKATFIGH